MEKQKARSLALLQALTDAHGAPGHEGPVRELVRRELEGLGTMATDGSGSLVCTMTEGSDGPAVMVAGHMDEVGFMVQHITPDGFLQFVPLGGWWSHTLLAQRVRIRTRTGDEVLGVVTSLPPHLLSKEAAAMVVPIERMFIDVGACSRSEATDLFGIALGDPVVPDSPLRQLANADRLMAKAFDNRVGMAVAVHAAQELAQRQPHPPPPGRTVVVGTVQEEVGCRGAITAAQMVKPDVAIILEGPPADDVPGLIPDESQGKLGRGVQIRLFDPTAIANPTLARLAIDTARDEGIPHQVAVRRTGGTDARSIHVSGTGVPTVVLGVPARYIHSHNAVIDLHDYLAAVRLTVRLVQKLDAETVRSLTTFGA